MAGAEQRPGVSSAYVTTAPALDRDIPEECDNCGGEDIIENWKLGKLVCQTCGKVMSDSILDYGSEWRNFSNDDGGGEDRNRAVGPANPLYEADHGTWIGSGDTGGGRGRRGGEGGTLEQTLNRAQGFARAAEASGDKVLKDLENLIQAIATRGELPKNVQNRALETCKRYYDFLTKKEGGGRSRGLKKDEKDDMAAASLHLACGMLGIPRQLNEIAGISATSKKRIRSMAKDMKQNLEGLQAARIQNPIEYVARHVTKLQLPSEYVGYVSYVTEKASDLEQIYGKQYQTIVAAAIYIICSLSEEKYRRSAKEIGQFVGVAEATVRQARTDIAPDLEKVLPPQFKPTEPLSVIKGVDTKKRPMSVEADGRAAKR